MSKYKFLFLNISNYISTAAYIRTYITLFSKSVFIFRFRATIKAYNFFFINLYIIYYFFTFFVTANLHGLLHMCIYFTTVYNSTSELRYSNIFPYYIEIILITKIIKCTQLQINY